MEVNQIPEGLYCYGHDGSKRVVCPYWSIREDKPNQNNGYCSYLKYGDWESEGLSLLWDQVKECGINREIKMDVHQILRVVGHYEKNLAEKGVEKKKNGSPLEHIRWMCFEIPDMVMMKGWEPKVNRWLGFIQGVLYSNKIYTIDEMRNHNKEI
jgi:hypothetical protein